MPIFHFSFSFLFCSIAGRGGDEEYIRLSQKVSSIISQISNNVNALQRMAGQLGTAKDSEEHREKMFETFETTFLLNLHVAKGEICFTGTSSPRIPAR